MTTIWRDGTTIARCLRVKGSSLDPTLTRLRVESLLNVADIHPAGLVPSAIVCIRRLCSPCSVVLPLGVGGVRPPQIWEQSIRSSLEQAIQHAVRPLFTPVPESAEAVLFLDRAELLACLASDWRTGRTATRWWWQSLFKGTDLTQSIVPLWLRAPEYVPAVLQHLAARQEAVPFVRLLSTDAAYTLLQSIMQSYTLSALATAIDMIIDERRSTSAHMSIIPTIPQSSPKNVAQTQARITSPESSPTNVAQSQTQITSPVHNQDDGSSPDIPTWTFSTRKGGTADRQKNDTVHHPVLAHIEQRPHRAPWQAIVPESGAPGLLFEQQSLLGIALLLRRAPQLVRASSFAQEVQQWYRAFSTFNLSPAPPSLHREVQTISSVTSSDSPLSNQQRIIEEKAQEKYIPIEYSTSSEATQRPPGRSQYSQSDSLLTSSDQTILPDETPVDADQLQEIEIHTAYGGIFYLLNLGLLLGLYADFASPGLEDIALDIWDFVALLGLQLVGEPLCADPAWELLAQLAGHAANELPGKDFVPTDQWQVPEEWLRALTTSEVWSPVWSHPTSSLKSWAGQAPQLERWLGELMPYVHARLCDALDLAVADLAQVLCIHRARILVTATHLDLFLSLDELPVEIRIAGLDRNPGWIPAAGRFITFYFS